MKYVSADIETSSLIPDPSQVLGIALVVEDTRHPDVPLQELPNFVCLVDHGAFSGQPYALWLNAWILKEIDEARNGRWPKIPVMSPEEAEANACRFLDEHFGIGKRAVFAGKNVAGFDLLFLPWLKERSKHRVLDPGPMFVDWDSDEVPPSLPEIKRRIGKENSVSHNMLEDALDVIDVLRTKYRR